MKEDTVTALKANLIANVEDCVKPLLACYSDKAETDKIDEIDRKAQKAAALAWPCSAPSNAGTYRPPVIASSCASRAGAYSTAIVTLAAVNGIPLSPGARGKASPDSTGSATTMNASA
ncbi:MAG: hypothetical protein Q7V63_04690 [Gammaproteobacteria bacterium]|nr:hypothetical protein [Gammaproteobacteria bacterium]